MPPLQEDEGRDYLVCQFRNIQKDLKLPRGIRGGWCEAAWQHLREFLQKPKRGAPYVDPGQALLALPPVPVPALPALSPVPVPALQAPEPAAPEAEEREEDEAVKEEDGDEVMKGGQDEDEGIEEGRGNDDDEDSPNSDDSSDSDNEKENDICALRKERDELTKERDELENERDEYIESLQKAEGTVEELAPLCGGLATDNEQLRSKIAVLEGKGAEFQDLLEPDYDSN